MDIDAIAGYEHAVYLNLPAKGSRGGGFGFTEASPGFERLKSACQAVLATNSLRPDHHEMDVYRVGWLVDQDLCIQFDSRWSASDERRVGDYIVRLHCRQLGEREEDPGHLTESILSRIRTFEDLEGTELEAGSTDWHDPADSLVFDALVPLSNHDETSLIVPGRHLTRHLTAVFLMMPRCSTRTVAVDIQGRIGAGDYAIDLRRLDPKHAKNSSQHDGLEVLRTRARQDGWELLWSEASSLWSWSEWLDYVDWTWSESGGRETDRARRFVVHKAISETHDNPGSTNTETDPTPDPQDLAKRFIADLANADADPAIEAFSEYEPDEARDTLLRILDLAGSSTVFPFSRFDDVVLTSKAGSGLHAALWDTPISAGRLEAIHTQKIRRLTRAMMLSRVDQYHGPDRQYLQRIDERGLQDALHFLARAHSLKIERTVSIIRDISSLRKNCDLLEYAWSDEVLSRSLLVESFELVASDPSIDVGPFLKKHAHSYLHEKGIPLAISSHLQAVSPGSGILGGRRRNRK